MSFPTQLTVLRIALAPVFFLLFAASDPPLYSWAAAVFVIGALSDWYDGYFARLWKLTSPLGAFLDPLADKLLTSAALIAFAAKDFIPVWAVVIIIGRDLYVTVFRVLAQSIDQPIKTSVLAKYKTFFQMVFICYFLAALVAREGTFGQSLVSIGSSALNPSLLYWSIFAVTMLTVVTAVQYSYENAQVLLRISRRYFLRRSPQELS